MLSNRETFSDYNIGSIPVTPVNKRRHQSFSHDELPLNQALKLAEIDIILNTVLNRAYCVNDNAFFNEFIRLYY